MSLPVSDQHVLNIHAHCRFPPKFCRLWVAELNYRVRQVEFDENKSDRNDRQVAEPQPS